MNRKNINDILKYLLPVSSSLVGAPSKFAEMAGYLKVRPGAGIINFIEHLDCSHELAGIPDFLLTRELVLLYSTFTARLNNARVWGKNGAVIGAGDYFIRDVSREFNEGMNVEHTVYYTIKQKKSKFLKGDIALIGTAGANIYYHWMLDILPRLALISKFISLTDISYFITEFTQLPFQIETLGKVGIPQTKIIPSNDNWGFHIRAERLWVSSLAGPLGQPTTFQVNFLRNLYKDCISNKMPVRKLYISRKKTGRREIVNEDKVLLCLSYYQFEIINCEEIPVAGQVRLFSEAAIIISSHGSALTNIVFCKPGAIILDIFNQSHINGCFWIISKMVDLNYHFMEGKSCPNDDNIKNDNTLVDINKFKEVLQKIGLTE